MRVVDPGHTFLLDQLDQPVGEQWDVPKLRYVKREGQLYPGNHGTQPGVTIQEVNRAQISRFKYLIHQALELGDFESAQDNEYCIDLLRGIIVRLEHRAARRHGRELILTTEEIQLIEFVPTCEYCGHIKCNLTCQNKTTT